MSPNPKRTAAIELLVAKGIWPVNYVPYGTRFLWWIGIDIPPPIFMSFWNSLLVAGGAFAAGYGLAIWIMRTPIYRTTMSAVLFTIGGGIICGLYVARRNANLRKKHNLPSWDELDGMP